MNNEIYCSPSAGDAFEVVDQISGNTYPQEWFFDWATAFNRSDAGVPVTGYTALRYAPIWQGVNIIAGDIGQVPVRLVRNEFDEQRRHPAWNLLRVRPNGLQTPSLWKETMMHWALLWGNGVSWIVRQGGRPVALIPLRPDALWLDVVALEDREEVLYRYWSPSSGETFTFLPDEVLHIQGITSDGLWGYPLWQVAKSTIGYGLALDKHGNRNFSNGAKPSGVLEHPGRLSPEARKNLRDEWQSIHGGAGNSGRTAILWEAMKFNPISMTNIDAQWIEAKKLNRIDAASLLNLPAHKLNALEDSSVRSNLEEQNETYKQMTLTRWANKLNEEFQRKLLTRQQWMSDEYEFKFDFDAFLRADIDTLTQVGDRLVKAEIMNRNEARRMIGMAPYPGGERFGSPAINPQESGQESGENTDSGDDEPINDVQSAVREALIAAVTGVIEMENNNLKRAASGSKNFVSWLDAFYLGDGGPSELSERFNKIAGKARAAAESVGLLVGSLGFRLDNYGLQRRRMLLETCSHVTQDGLSEAVATYVDSSPEEVATALVDSSKEAPDDGD